MTRLEQIAHAEQHIERLEAQLVDMEPAYWAAFDAWSAKPDKPESPKLRKEFDRQSKNLHSTHQAINSYKAQINRLNHPATVAREEQTKTRLEHLMSSKPKKQTAAERGVPTIYLSETGSFKPGMDARFKSDIIGTILVHEGLEKSLNKKALSTFSVEDAHRFIAEFGWVAWLDKSKGARVKKQEAAHNKAEKAKTAAASKKSRAASKPKDEGESTGTLNAETGEIKMDEVTPDPKPAPKPRANRGRRGGAKAA